MRSFAALLFVLGATVATPVRASAQEHAESAADETVDIITPHITDSYRLDVPYWAPPFVTEICIGREVGGRCEPLWEPVHVGGLMLQFSPTKHVLMLLIASLLCGIVMISAARSHVKHTAMIGRPRGFGTTIEAMVLYLRDEIILPTVGHHGEKFVPYLLAIFFFLLFANLMGLIPYGATPTGNISVTAAMAILSFVVVEISGMRALGMKYLSTIFYWNTDLPLPMRIVMFLIMSPVEFISKLTKPFALAIRLFANMTAGHIVVLAFIGLIFTFKGVASGLPFLMAIGIMLLEIFVAFLQAFIFMLLTSVFIGLVREAAH